MKKEYKYLLLSILLTLTACSKDDNLPVETPVTNGQADFTKYVALGDSFTAGYSDNALFIKGQENSFPNILSQQFIAANGGTFATPFMKDNIGGLLFLGNIILEPRLFLNNGIPNPVSGTPSTETTNHLAGPFNNLGIPGAKSFHLLASGYGNPNGIISGTANPYFARFASSTITTMINDAIVQKPTFFSLFIGSNDVLSYATSGGTGKDQTGNKNILSYGSNDITDPTTFGEVYSTLITGLTANGAKGIVANIPYITTLPYFTTVAYNSVPLTEAIAQQLNTGYTPYNQILQTLVKNKVLTNEEATRRTVNFTAGNNAVVIEDKYLTDLTQLGVPSYRQATKEDLLVLTSLQFIGTSVGGDPLKVNGLSVPLADKWVLSKEETVQVVNATDAYNQIIETLAQAKGLALADIKSVMIKLHNEGITSGNITLSSKYITGAAFSLDGIHPSARGYALVSNIFVDAINTKYKSTLRHVDLEKYATQYAETIQ